MMKKIQLKTIYKGDKSSIRSDARKHCVCISSDIRISFSDYRAAESFLSRANDFFNVKLFELNELYLDLFIHYRRNWFYFEYNIQDEAACTRAFETINKSMSLMVNRSHYENGPVMVNNWMIGSFTQLISIIEILKELHRKRNNWAEIRILDSQKNRILFILSQIETFGLNSL